jgi:hypothetical protein
VFRKSGSSELYHLLTCLRRLGIICFISLDPEQQVLVLEHQMSAREKTSRSISVNTHAISVPNDSISEAGPSQQIVS